MRCAAPMAASSSRCCCCMAAVRSTARGCSSKAADGSAPRYKPSAFPKVPNKRQRSPPTSAAGDVLFNKVGVLQPGELDGKAIFEVAHDPTLHLAERNQRADRRPLIRGDGGARLRYVDDAAADVDTIRHDKPAERVARHDAAVAAVLGQPQDVTVGKPCELGSELVALARARPNGHGEAVLESARNMTFEAAQMIDVGDDA